MASKLKDVVKVTIRSCASGVLHGCLLILSSTLASAVLADEPMELAPGLRVSAPQPLSIQYIEDDSEPESLVLLGHIEGQPAYFMAANKVEDKQRATVLWEKLEMKIRSHADRSSFELSNRGIFTANGGAKVWYRGYEYSIDDRKQRPIYYLIRQEGVSYWVTLTAADKFDLKVVQPIADVILKNVQVLDQLQSQ